MFATLRDMAEAVAVSTLRVAVCLDHRCNFETLFEEKEVGEEVFNMFGVNRDNQPSFFLG